MWTVCPCSQIEKKKFIWMQKARSKRERREKKSTNTFVFLCFVPFGFFILFYFLIFFYRRDSFITHRAFCDALAEESARAITANPVMLSSHHHHQQQQQQPAGSSTTSHINLQTQFNINPHHHQDLHGFTLKKEQPTGYSGLRQEIPPWLACNPGPPHLDISSSSSIFSTRLDHHQDFNQDLSNNIHDQAHHPNPNPSLGPTLPPYQPTPSPHMSATALLQKAAQMGATMSSKTSNTTTTTGTSSSTSPASMTLTMMRPHQQAHVSAAAPDSSGGNFGLNLSSREEMETTGFAHGLAAFGNKAALLSSAASATTTNTTTTTGGGGGTVAPNSFLHDMMNSLSSGTGFEGTSFEEAFGGILNHNSKKDHFNDKTRSDINESSTGGGGGGGNRGHESLTRDFLGLRALSHSDILNIAGLENCMNTTSRDHQNQTHKPWQG